MKKRYIPFILIEIIAIGILLVFVNSLLRTAFDNNPIGQAVVFIIVPIIIALIGIITLQIWSK